ncbi:MAG: hypothetical protein AAF492_22330, partial [Verrucomicrobiota bacterium]
MWRRWWWLVVVLVIDVLLVIWWRSCERADEGSLPPGGASNGTAQLEPAVPVTPPLTIGFPTAQTNLTRRMDKTVFMPTGSGRVMSAHYGSTRTDSSGRPSFHEGVDIGPMARDRRGRATDKILAVADGTVAYANRRSGNSNYGIYIVLEHEDPVRGA